MIDPAMGELGMIRSIFIAGLVFVATAAEAQAPKAQKLMACKQLARDRGFTFGVHNKGGIKPKDFVRGCMQGTQR
jgi:hypothetical protein